MSEFKEYRLGDVSEDVSYGYTESANEKPVGPKFLRITDIRNGYIDWDKVPYCVINEKEYLKNKIEIGDIVIARTGATTGITATIKHDIEAVFASYLIRFKINKSLANPFYVGHVLKSQIWQDYVSSIIGGSAQPGANAKQFSDFSFKLPSLQHQNVITEILTSLDDKIELNNKINQELETLAQTLFKQWFIDFEFPNEIGEPYKSSGGEMVDSELGEIPKSWDRIKLADLVTKSHTGADAITRAPIVDYDTGIKCARVGDMTNNRSFHNWAFCKISPEDYKRQKLEIGDIIVTRTATLGINQLIREKIEAVCNNGLIRLKINDTICDPMFVYVQLQASSFKEWINRISGDSSTRPNMQMDYLLDFSVIIPPKELMNSFVELAITFYDLIDKNNISNEELIITRDTLLPKLISGELEINEISN